MTKTSAKSTGKNNRFLLTKKQFVLIFTVLWLHINILDMFLVTRRGARILWQESLQLDTQLIHFILAALATACFYYFSFIAQKVSDAKAATTPIDIPKDNGK